MAEPVQLRVAPPPGTIVVIRLGTQTLGDEKLAQQCERTHARWGFHGFSVFEVPDDDFRLLARLVPIVTVRPKLFEARGGDLIEAGFPLIPKPTIRTGQSCGPTVTRTHFARVRTLFEGPKDNPAWSGGG